MSLETKVFKKDPEWEGFTDQWEFAPSTLVRVTKILKNRDKAIAFLEEAVSHGRLAGVIRTSIHDYDVMPIPSEPVIDVKSKSISVKHVAWSRQTRAIRIGPAFFKNRTSSKFSDKDEEWENGRFTVADPSIPVLIKGPDGNVTALAPGRHIAYGVHFFRPDVDLLVKGIGPNKTKKVWDATEPQSAKGRLRDRPPMSPLQRDQLLGCYKKEADSGALRNLIGVGRGSQAELIAILLRRSEEIGIDMSESTAKRRARELLDLNEKRLSQQVSLDPG